MFFPDVSSELFHTSESALESGSLTSALLWVALCFATVFFWRLISLSIGSIRGKEEWSLSEKIEAILTFALFLIATVILKIGFKAVMSLKEAFVIVMVTSIFSVIVPCFLGSARKSARKSKRVCASSTYKPPEKNTHIVKLKRVNNIKSRRKK